MKILYIDQPIEPPGGGQLSLLVLLKKVRREKKVFLPFHCSFSRRLEKENIDFEIVSCFSLFGAIRKFAPDIIHCNSATTRYSFFSAVCARLLGIPFIWHVRVSQKALIKDDIIAFLSSRIIAVSMCVRDKFSKLWHNKTDIIFNAVDDSFGVIKDNKIREKLSIREGEKVIGVFSRFEDWKGHDIFVQSAIKILQKGYLVRFIFCGTGKNENKIKENVFSSSYASKFIFMGHVDNVQDYMKACDIVVNPSVRPEAFGRVVAEAMSIGKIIVATAVGGHLEIIKDGFNGFLCRPESASLAAAIEKALNCGREIPGNALEFSKIFSSQRHISQIDKIYLKLYDENSGRRKRI